MVEVAKQKQKRKKSNHYVSNKELLVAMVEYRNLTQEWKSNGSKGSKPRVTDYIGECILKIAEHISFMPNFASYTYKDEMVCDGIENCLRYIDNFNPEKSKNPFAYFTQIIHFAFVRRIHKEKKQQYVKYKSIEDDRLHNDDPDVEFVLDKFGTEEFNLHMRDFIDSFEETKNLQKKNKKKKKTESCAIDDLLDVDN